MSTEETLIDRLNNEADLCRNDGADDIANLLGEAVAALEEAEKDRRDAERYRWLRENADAAGQNEQTPMVVMTDEDGSITSLPGYCLTHFALDEAIDAAMTAAPALAGR